MKHLVPICCVFVAACGGRAGIDAEGSAIQIEGATSVDAANPITLRLQLRDTDGIAVRGATVAWEVSGRENDVLPGTATTDANGEAVAWLRSHRAELKIVRVQVADVELTERIEVLPGVPGSASVLAVNPISAAANGASAVHFALTTRDRYGNVVPFVSVAVALRGADLRTLAPVPQRTAVDGSLSFDLVSRVAGDKEIAVQAGPLSFTRHVHFDEP